MSKQQHSRLDRLVSTITRILGGPIDGIARAEEVGLVSIMRVDLSPDLRRATVYVSTYGSPDVSPARADIAGVLNERAAELQQHLARGLRTRRIPVLEFRPDANLEHADRIERLLDTDREQAGDK